MLEYQIVKNSTVIQFIDYRLSDKDNYLQFLLWKLKQFRSRYGEDVQLVLVKYTDISPIDCVLDY